MADATDRDANTRPVRRCPICGTSTALEFRPFCSRRCADVDLARWLNGSYAIAGGDADADEDGDDIATQGLRNGSASDQR